MCMMYMQSAARSMVCLLLANAGRAAAWQPHHSMYIHAGRRLFGHDCKIANRVELMPASNQGQRQSRQAYPRKPACSSDHKFSTGCQQ
jgi:hypothetical protein